MLLSYEHYKMIPKQFLHFSYILSITLCYIDDGLCPLANDTQATNEVAGEAIW